ncbi:MAG: hypothetical protein IJC84_02725 [Clostridia bacterium]|nr:hypothetical protein [Clostridia bacterium]
MIRATFSKRRILSVLLALLLAVSLLSTVSYAAEEESIIIKVDEIEETEGGATVTLKIQNNTGSRVSFGWVNSCDVLITTDDGDYSCRPPHESIKIGKSTVEMQLEDIEGKIERIELTELCLLSDDGLPSEEMHDVVIYDKAEGIKSFEGEFAYFSSPQNIIMTIISIVPFLMVGIFVVVGIIVFLNVRKNRRADEEMAMGLDFGAGSQDMGAEMHRQAHETAMRDHANFVNQQNLHNHIQIHNDFTQQSMNTTDMGGFNPPPTPPAGM